MKDKVCNDHSFSCVSRALNVFGSNRTIISLVYLYYSIFKSLNRNNLKHRQYSSEYWEL